MTRTLLRLMLAAAAGLVLSIGGLTAASASTEVTSTAECPSAKWQVNWTTEDAETLRTCGGETIASRTEASTTSSELPLTSGLGLIAAGLAVALLGLGVGLHLIARHQRRIFTS